MEINETIATFQSSELLQQAERGQALSNEIVAIMQDGRKIRQVNDYRCEVTTYKGAPATNAQIGEQMERLRKNYTQMASDFWAALIGELINDKWTAARITDAVSHVLRTKTGGFLSIADIMSFDKPMKLYNYNGYLWLINTKQAKDEGEGNPKTTIEKIYINKGKPNQQCFWYMKKDLPKNISY